MKEKFPTIRELRDLAKEDDKPIRSSRDSVQEHSFHNKDSGKKERNGYTIAKLKQSPMQTNSTSRLPTIRKSNTRNHKMDHTVSPKTRNKVVMTSMDSYGHAEPQKRISKVISSKNYIN